MTAQPIDPDRVKHLEFIQIAIGRLSTNSFLLKGWTLTLLAAFLAVTGTAPNPLVSVAALVPVGAFWGLDAYFLRQERGFRALYESARQPDTTVEPFAMNPRDFVAGSPFGRVVRSATLLGFYGPLMLADLVFLVLGLAR